jgi:distribution and morphology protein 31
VKRGFTSASILFVEIPSTSTVSNTVTSSASVTEKSLLSTYTIPRQSTTSLAQQAWRKSAHSSNGRRITVCARRNKSTSSKEQSTKKSQEDKTKESEKKESPKVEEEVESGINAYLHLPHLHRPTKEEFLAAATGFWSRLKARFKWFSIRSSRPWNIDDWSAFVSWFVLGNLGWLLIGTTTFFSLVVLTINTVVAQGEQITSAVSGHTGLTRVYRNLSTMGR